MEVQWGSSFKSKTLANVSSKAWLHFVAGGIGGMVGATVTSPLDVMKTRLQSTLYNPKSQSTQPFVRSTIPIFGHFIDTGRLLTYVYRNEGWRAFFKGLGPNLVGVVPARAINFFTYGNGKRILTNWNGEETPLVQCTAAIFAGITTSTLTNPIWLVKTRMQLQNSSLISYRPVKYKNSFDCVIKVVREEGISGLYKGLTASYLGVTESTIHWVAYEYLKSKLSERRNKKQIISDESVQPFHLRMFDNLLAAGLSKFVAACISYPHEVIRTRMRQLPVDAKYAGIIQCFKTILREEGISAFYGGMTAHMMRVVPNAAIMFFCYESILHYGDVYNNKS